MTEKCDMWHPQAGYDECWGTKEREPVLCEGRVERCQILQPRIRSNRKPMSRERAEGLKHDPMYSLHNGCLWLESVTGALAPVFPDLWYNDELRIFSPFLLAFDGSFQSWWPASGYNNVWRLWTERPTEQERRAAPWD